MKFILRQPSQRLRPPRPGEQWIPDTVDLTARQALRVIWAYAKWRVRQWRRRMLARAKAMLG